MLCIAATSCASRLSSYSSCSGFHPQKRMGIDDDGPAALCGRLQPAHDLLALHLYHSFPYLASYASSASSTTGTTMSVYSLLTCQWRRTSRAASTSCWTFVRGLALLPGSDRSEPGAQFRDLALHLLTS